jgi:hypothetical protein
MAKIVKITKITKTLKGTPFHVLPLSCRRLLPLSRRGEKKRPMEN